MTEVGCNTTVRFKYEFGDKGPHSLEIYKDDIGSSPACQAINGFLVQMKSAIWYTDKPLMPMSGIAEERSQIGILACTEIASSGILAYFIAK